MSKTPFQFKKFSVLHSESAMPIGVDSVLLGSWAKIEDAKTILDIGTGCGILALMCAQKNPIADITGIDSDYSSINEAGRNFRNSCWDSRLHELYIPWEDFSGSGYDVIISNPPYYDSGVKEIGSGRLKARHQGVLSPKSILNRSHEILNPEGKIFMVFPTEQLPDILHGLPVCIKLTDYLLIRGRETNRPKRILVEFSFISKNNLNIPGLSSHINDEEGLSQKEDLKLLTLYDHAGKPSDPFKQLCKEFYLKF